jgi:hypothetical protein
MSILLHKPILPPKGFAVGSIRDSGIAKIVQANVTGQWMPQK